ncbi:phosphoribosyltransferase domain-containing protein [uncultured Brevundimonas sp.]|uniref:phosphoribosyltransferase domain-containing protein n=1 Tax=Brevundimonas TaxID=41275 RepID=UPI00260EA280|nr:phosphoribosyltransferase domain-containing protein [uncultured Brevundimonas sp.]
MTIKRAITLSGGTVEIEVCDAALPLDHLCAFAARNNAKRGFLIVSKVLGRHMPARPLQMQAAVDALTSRILLQARDLPGPVVFIGLAETAVCLGQSVHDAFGQLSGRKDTLFLHTTRQTIDAKVMATFTEPHSHAAMHLIYAPELETHRRLMQEARSLVLIDDEVSTGVTLVNLAQAIEPHLPSLERICTATLADWSNAADYSAAMPKPAEAVSLLEGAIAWRSNGEAQSTVPTTVPVAALGLMTSHVNFGRLGVQARPQGIDKLAADLIRDQDDRFLIIGTGEFTWPPFLLAHALELAGHDVTMQATSRSPVRLGGAIGSALTFEDNYGTGVPNYLYNARREEGRRVIICHETPVGSIDPALVDALDAECLFFGVT